MRLANAAPVAMRVVVRPLNPGLFGTGTGTASERLPPPLTGLMPPPLTGLMLVPPAPFALALPLPTPLRPPFGCTPLGCNYRGIRPQILYGKPLL